MSDGSGFRVLAHGLAMLGVCVALSACNASLPGPARSPVTVPSTLDTGTPAKSNLARNPAGDGERV
ncbi:MAG: hypothetical protein IPJ28_18265 [Betaproteobacteria bacterium]|nr:hypothetical protein [Betaproteobacteria bacterium]